MGRPTLDEFEVRAQRTRLVHAALALYRERGYEAITLRNVAAQLDISHTTPYRYFHSKAELVAAVRAEVWTAFASQMEQHDSLEIRPIDHLRDICLAVVEFGVRYPAEYRLIFALRQPAAGAHPALDQARGNAVNVVVAVCQRAIDARQLRGDALTWAHVAWSTIHGLVTLHVASQLVLGRQLAQLVQPVLTVLLPGATPVDWKTFEKRLKRPLKSRQPARPAL